MDINEIYKVADNYFNCVVCTELTHATEAVVAVPLCQNPLCANNGVALTPMTREDFLIGVGL